MCRKAQSGGSPSIPGRGWVSKRCIVDYHRFEGTSDPDDTSVIYALETNDGTLGTLVDAYGAYVDPAVGALLERMTIDRRSRRAGWLRRLAPWLAGAGALVVGLVALAEVFVMDPSRGGTSTTRATSAPCVFLS